MWILRFDSADHTSQTRKPAGLRVCGSTSPEPNPPTKPAGHTCCSEVCGFKTAPAAPHV